MDERPVLVELVLALAAGAAMVAGMRVGQELCDPYSDARLTLAGWLERARGGES